MLVVDTSALMAILLGEPEADELRACIAGASERVISAANFVELGTVIAGRSGKGDAQAVLASERLLAAADITIAPITADLARRALHARIRFGRGFGHRARLNFGDCFAYALAISLDAPLLFIGDDFAHTDARPALPR
ncbi:type II toxin-antitoxin system VapC family toxin [Maricaulis sp.]|uniref:type II toxin-antitoxin system VapC family toxin n=1 Tax=Maricaulis sp. TaxID=1486257 RepID=UPI003A9242F4